MEETPNVNNLYSRYHERLALQWIAGQKGSSRPLSNIDHAIGESLVGHLNTIHPNRLQIIGKLELEHLRNLNKSSREDLLSTIYDAEPAALIIAEAKDNDQESANREVFTELQKRASDSHTPLLNSELTSVKLINDLHHFLSGELAKKTIIHGVFMEIHGMGVMLTGESGIGKSELALELITRNHRLVADDAPEFSHLGPDTIRGACPDAIRDFLEVRGMGILNIRSMYGDSAIKISKDLRLILHLEKMAIEDIQKINRLEGSYSKKNILDIEIPVMLLPVAAGRNLAVLAEAAVRHHILLRKGYNASEAFIARQQQHIQQQNQNEE